MAEKIMRGMVIRQRFTVAYILIIVGAVLALMATTYMQLTGAMPPYWTFIVPIGILLLAIIGILGLFLKYLATSFTITDREIIKNEGIVTRTVRSIPFTKVDNITQRRGILDLVLQTGTLIIETPAGPGPEIIMHFLPSSALPQIEELVKCRMAGKDMPAGMKGKCDVAEDVVSREKTVKTYDEEMPARETPYGRRTGRDEMRPIIEYEEEDDSVRRAERQLAKKKQAKKRK